MAKKRAKKVSRSKKKQRSSPPPMQESEAWILPLGKQDVGGRYGPQPGQWMGNPAAPFHPALEPPPTQNPIDTGGGSNNVPFIDHNGDVYWVPQWGHPTDTLPNPGNILPGLGGGSGHGGGNFGGGPSDMYPGDIPLTEGPSGERKPKVKKRVTKKKVTKKKATPRTKSSYRKGRGRGKPGRKGK